MKDKFILDACCGSRMFCFMKIPENKTPPENPNTFYSQNQESNKRSFSKL